MFPTPRLRVSLHCRGYAQGSSRLERMLLHRPFFNGGGEGLTAMGDRHGLKSQMWQRLTRSASTGFDCWLPCCRMDKGR